MSSHAKQRRASHPDHARRRHPRDDIRAFLAVRLPVAATAALSRIVDRMIQTKIVGLKPVRPENMHLTLKFFGSVGAEQVHPIIDAVTEAVVPLSPFTLRLGNIGAYPNTRNPRVLWVGLDGDTVALLDTRRRIEKALAQIAFPPDSREFKPHFTVARIRDSVSPADRRRAAEMFFSSELHSEIPIRVNSVTLTRSVLRPEGPQYSVLADIPLG